MSVKQLLKDLFSLFRAGKEQLAKIALGDHGDPCELAAVDAQDLDDLLVYILLSCDDFTVWKGQFRIGFLQCKSLTAGFWTVVFRVTANVIFFASQHKAQFHKSRRFLVCIVRPEHGSFPDLTTGFSVKCESDRIKYGRFSGTGISCDQVQPSLSQAGKFHFGAPCIRAESGHDKFQRPQLAPSFLHMLPIISARNCSCSSVNGALFCSS